MLPATPPLKLETLLIEINFLPHKSLCYVCPQLDPMLPSTQLQFLGLNWERQFHKSVPQRESDGLGSFGVQNVPDNGVLNKARSRGFVLG